MKRLASLGAVAVLVLAVGACRSGDDDGDEGGAGGVTTDVGVTTEACPEAVNPDNGDRKSVV